MYNIFREVNGYASVLVKRRNQEQCLLENYNTCLAFVYTTFVWDMENISTTRMCNVNVVMPAIV